MAATRVLHVPVKHPLNRLSEPLKKRIVAAQRNNLELEFKDAAGKVLDESSVHWKELSDQALAYVKENPGKSVLAGLGAGFLIGLLFRE